MTNYVEMRPEGLIVERLPSGNFRLRVRVKGKPTQRITIPDNLSKDDFLEAYAAARNGIPCTYRPTTLDALRNKPGFMGTIFNMLNRSKQRARRKRLEFALTVNDIFDALERQDGKCALTGMMFDINPRPRRGQKRPFCMSIDRINNKGGYTADNVRISTVIANLALSDWREDDFRKMCVAASSWPTPISHGTQ